MRKTPEHESRGENGYFDTIKNKYTSVCHLNVIVASRRWRSGLSCRSICGGSRSGCTLSRFLGCHTLQVDLDILPFKDAEWSIWMRSLLMCTYRADNTNGGIIDGKLFVLLESLA